MSSQGLPGGLAALSVAALAVAEEAGRGVLEAFRSRPEADEKGERDLVTAFDRESEALIVARLRALTPGIPIVGEEDTRDATAPGRHGPIWYVDPLDGTTNFVHGHPFWAVAIGLMIGDVPVLGAVAAPSLGLRWHAWGAPLEGAAFRCGARCAVSATDRLERALIATGFPPKRDVAPDNNFDAFMAVKRRAQAVRRCGSAAIDLCMVGDGTYEGFWERRLHVWDVVAGSAVVLAAGGTITDLDGGPPCYHVGHIVASNGRVHDDMVRLVGS